jgi:hypothetical protein
MVRLNDNPDGAARDSGRDVTYVEAQQAAVSGDASFLTGQVAATFVAMTSNFAPNNMLT